MARVELLQVDNVRVVQRQLSFSFNGPAGSCAGMKVRPTESGLDLQELAEKSSVCRFMFSETPLLGDPECSINSF